MAMFWLTLLLEDFEKTSSYQERNIEGFNVKISREALKDRKNLEPAIALLTLRFKEIVARVPKSALPKLRMIPTWIERDNPKIPCMCYHPDKNWLKSNGMNPDKEKGVELSNLKNFVLWSIDQPSMVLHEYAHGFHDTVYGFEIPLVLDAYKLAMDQHLYDEVSYYRGQKKKAYAATNQMEYFAELTEAYFGFNDFFPFTKPELESYDSVGAKMIGKAWGVTP